MNTPVLSRRAALALCATPLLRAARRQSVRELTEADRSTIRAEKDWYMHSAGVEYVHGELVCTYRRSDEHIASVVEVWCARSKDGGRTWTDHRLITKTSFEADKACWVAPQLGSTRDGRLLLLIDKGVKLSKFDWPMLSIWQQKERGMSNHLFVSKDAGKTWEGPHKTDDFGGEPSYIVELSNGSLMYTRTDSKPTTAIKVPSERWGPNYYRSTAVFSDDKGKTWNRTSVLADDPLVGDCEVGCAEYAPGKLIAITRIGDSGSALGQPSRFVFSNDFGKTWSKPVLSPIYAHRASVHPLKSGKLLVSYRNAWGTTGSCAFVFSPEEKFTYQPNSLIWDDSRVRLAGDTMEMRTTEGRESGAEFTLYPVEDDDSAVEFEAELAVKEAGQNGGNISAGCWIRFLPDRVELADRSKDSFAIDATKMRKYRIVNRDRRIRIFADGELKLDAPVEGVFTRHVRFGNRSGAPTMAPAPLPGQTTRAPLRGTQYHSNASHSVWRSIAVKVQNRRDHSIDWNWTAKDGCPDQFYRNRVIRLEKNGSFAAGDSGYSNWTQMPDGNVVVVDYTSGVPAVTHPVLRAYRLGKIS